MPPETPASETIQQLTQSLQFMRGVGPARAELLAKLGLHTVADVLFFFPRSYQDFTQQHDIADLQPEQLANVVGVVDDIDQIDTQSGRNIVYVLIRQGNQFLRGTWFNQPFMLRRFAVGQQVMFQGKTKLQGGRQQMTHPKVTWIDDDAALEQQRQLVPVYRLTDGINQPQMRRLVAETVSQCASLVTEAFPDSMRDQANICGISTAIEQIHSPKDQQQADEARARLVYQELFILQLALAIRRHRIRTQNVSPALKLTPKIRSRLLRRLPFELSESQQNAFREIAADMNQPFPMNRLLHGEVGSGKTVVALCAMLTAVANGHQATIMAPTELLARQHLRSIQKMLAGSRVSSELWTGSVTASQRKPIAEKVAAGEIDIVVGTQAVVASSLKFASLGIAVIDEQHKFGVKQRATLKQSGHDPHYLVMTATPIPRTVSMTLFGDLDVSVLQRTTGLGQRVHTYLGKESEREQWWEFVKKKVRQGRQAFVVAPLVDGDDDQSLDSAERMFENLSNGPLADFRLDVLHGRMSAEEKEAAMQAFASGATQIIIATSVVEVGIDVPNATVMTIESAERFGLSQLHQLRGRVSRGQHPGYVCVFASSDDPESNERLTAFAELDNGFELAEADLKIRGPGNLFSTRQSGMPPLLIADLVRDTEIIVQARADAQSLVRTDPELADPQLSRLRQLVFARYGRVLEISDVG